MIDSIEPIHEEWGWLLAHIDNFFLFIFFLEYAATIFAVRNKWGFIFSAWGILDFMAILPTILSFFNLEVLRVLRLLRLLRMLRVLKLVKAARAGKQTGQSSFVSDLQTYMVSMFCAVMIGATLAYFAEEGAPETAIPNIAAGVWWTVNILGGVNAIGPVTAAGQGVGIAFMFVSLVLIAALMFLTEQLGSSSADAEANLALGGAGGLSMRHMLIYFGVMRAGGSGFALPPPPPLPPGTRPGTKPPPPPPPPPLPPRFEELRRCPDCTVSKGPMPTWYAGPARDWLARRTAARMTDVAPKSGEAPILAPVPPGIRGLIVRAFGREDTAAYQWMQMFLMAVVYVSVAVFLLDTVPELLAQYEHEFQLIEGVTSVIFIAEFVFTLYASSDRKAYVTSVWGIIDMLSLVPAVFGIIDTMLILPAVLGVADLSGLRLMKSVRLLRVLRVIRTLKALRSLKSVSPLGDVRGAAQTYLVLLFSTTVIIGAVVYEAELMSGKQTFTSALEGVWWALNKLAGVEAGNTPTSVAGQGIASIAVFAGISLWGYLVFVIRLALYGREGSKVAL